MGKRQLTFRDMKIEQGQRRDAYFARMRKKGGGLSGPPQPVVEARPEAAEELRSTAEQESSAEAMEAPAEAQDTDSEEANA